MFTASHNPADYNGIKLCGPGASPIGQDTGLRQVRERVATIATGGRPTPTPGRLRQIDVLSAYAAHLVGLAPVSGRRLKVVVDAGNGMAGLTVPAVVERLGEDRVELVPMYFELDGSFPHHEANPIDPSNLVDLQKRVVAEDADLGLAFDGDADRCFLVDELGEPVSPSALTALIAARELERHPGATIIHNLITSRVVPELVTERGGTPVRSRVGHSFIKAIMAETGAVFGGEHSGHFYFRDFWRADSGLLAALHALAALAATDRPASALFEEFARYPLSGEINSEVPDPHAVIARVRAHHADREDVEVDDLDGLTVTHADWWFNVRPSNTEPLLRLNVEGRDHPTMARVRDDVLSTIRSHR
jgi:phosphomannomutase